MTGPEHYAEAERLIGVATEHMRLVGQSLSNPTPPSYADMDMQTATNAGVLALAQAHATLALAAATAVAPGSLTALADRLASESPADAGFELDGLKP